MRARYDIAIVGYGPVGQTLAILLGRLGYTVAVFERRPDLYPRPRAVHYDDEVARIFQRLGICEQLAPITEAATTYEWLNARGQTLLHIDRTGPGPSGWPAATMFSQPQLERILDDTAKAVPAVEVFQGWEVTDLADRGAEVLLSVRHGLIEEAGHWAPDGPERGVLAAYAIGCDGANSLVRERMNTAVEDLGFVFDWLIADTVPHDSGLLAGVNRQYCDPERPTTVVSGGPGRRRWEWMLLPGESRREVEDPGFVWSLLAKSGVGEDQVALERHTVYTFRARWAERFRVGRMLLAGDAAHLMPPFAGQGMCSGVRDAFSLAWHLDLVLKGTAAEASLDAYTSERRGHLQHAIALSVELGKVICITDEAEAAARDEVLLALAADPSAPPPLPPAPNLGPGIHDGPPGDDHLSAGGTLFPQAEVCVDGHRCLLEDTLAGGFTLYGLDVDPSALLDTEAARYLEALGGSAVCLHVQLDCGNVYRAWFEAHECAVALVRPDFYVFGTAVTAEETCRLVHRLRVALTTPPIREETLTP
ncbi:MAG TPA: bifunctional 3-(3-hydroxy-phenyl)propionate/3-hydroxycinnamic acid hydroxylase [Solirubrobacteraceae bacterium]|nr:bifunctional 3-(3-hydroxy-phenyl)propionate/3-hydroxycinnamic acid hydroxylase [Solirubrobacteraceae bacterium]